MKKLIVSTVVALSLIGGVASAQTYYPSGSSSTGGCVSVSQYLSVGSTGSQVLALQQFLVSQNYPGGGAWMETSYFGQATAAAVRDFQQSQNLPQTGVVDAATQSALSRVSCGGSSYSYGTTYPSYTSAPAYPYTTPYVAPYTPTYPYNYSYGTPVITSLSINTGGIGTPVTIQGSNFDPSNNTVYFGTLAVANVASNGTSISFTVPQYSGSGNVEVYVTDSRGSSNSLAFNYISGNYACNTYPYTSCGNCNSTIYTYGYVNTGNNNCGGCATNVYPYTSGSIYPYTGSNCGTNNTSMPTITYLNPQSGAVGTSVTVYGSGFSTSGNTIHFGQGIITNAISSDGQGVSFTVPSQLTGYGSTQVTLGTYNVSVTNAYGITSNALPFTVSSLGGTGAPTITSVTGPATLQTGTSGLWTVNLNTQNYNTYTTVSVNWGDQNVYGGTNTTAPQTSSTQGTQTLSFNHTYLVAGTYTVTFTASNNSGASSTYTATVVVSGSGTTGNLSLTYLSPMSGYPGTQVQLIGSGFTSDNTVHFGIGGTQHVPSQNGTTVYFTVPSYLSACDVTTSGSYCSMLAQLVTPGSYPIYVTNANGTTNTVTYNVL